MALFLEQAQFTSKDKNLTYRRLAGPLKSRVSSASPYGQLYRDTEALSLLTQDCNSINSFANSTEVLHVNWRGSFVSYQAKTSELPKICTKKSTADNAAQPSTETTSLLPASHHSSTYSWARSQLHLALCSVKTNCTQNLYTSKQNASCP